MKIAIFLIAGAMIAHSGLAQAQTAPNPGVDKTHRTDMVRVPRASASQPVRNEDVDRFIDSEQKRIDHMMAICNGC